MDWRLGFKAPLPMLARYKQGARALGPRRSWRPGTETNGGPSTSRGPPTIGVRLWHRNDCWSGQLVRIASRVDRSLHRLGSRAASGLDGSGPRRTSGDPVLDQFRLSIVECLRGNSALGSHHPRPGFLPELHFIGSLSLAAKSDVIPSRLWTRFRDISANFLNGPAFASAPLLSIPCGGTLGAIRALAMHLRAMKELVNRACPPSSPAI